MSDKDKQDEYSPPLDAGIARAVEILRGAGIETYESCEGGDIGYFTQSIK